MEAGRVTAQDFPIRNLLTTDFAVNLLLNQFCLFIAQKRDHAKGFSTVFLLFDTRRNQSSDRLRFFRIRLGCSHPLSVPHTIVDNRWQKVAVAGITKRLDLIIIGKHIAESDDFWDTAEMLAQHQRLEGRCGNIVNRSLYVVQMRIGDLVPDIRLFQCSHLIFFCTNSHWADLLVIANHDKFFAHVEDGEGGNIRLTGLINDNNVKLILLGV